MTITRPGGTLQQEHALIEMEQARSAELETRVAQAEQVREAKAASFEERPLSRVRHAIARRLHRG